jgi:hypothetical protein
MWAAFVLMSAAAVHPAAAETCEVYTGHISQPGGLSWSLFISTPVFGCIADEQGNCDPPGGGGYLYLKNFSNDRAYWASLAAGQGVFSPLGPQGELIKYLPIYLPKGQTIKKIDLQVKMCTADQGAGPQPGANKPGPGGGSTPGGGNVGGNPGGSQPPGSDTAFIELTYQFSQRGEWRYQSFWLTQNTSFDVRFAADYSAQAAIIHESELENFKNGRGFRGYALYDGQFGTYRNVTLGPGTYYAVVRNAANGGNAVRLEVDRRLSVPGAVFVGWDVGAAELLQPGAKVWRPLTISPGVRYFIDGANSGLQSFLLPNSEIGNFSAGQPFRYYVDYSRFDDQSAPGQWEITLPAGTYWLAFRNQGATPHAVTYQVERWQPTSAGRANAFVAERTEATAAHVTGGFQRAWVTERTRSIVLQFDVPLEAPRLSADQFRVSLGGSVVVPSRVEYHARPGLVVLHVPELAKHPDGPTVRWEALRTTASDLLAGSTDPLARRSAEPASLHEAR